MFRTVWDLWGDTSWGNAEPLSHARRARAEEVHYYISSVLIKAIGTVLAVQAHPRVTVEWAKMYTMSDFSTSMKRHQSSPHALPLK